MWGRKSKKQVARKDTMLESLKPYFLCIFCSFCYAGFIIISKVCLDKGMSRYVLVAYGYAFGTLTAAILALLFERKNESKISMPIGLYIFFLGLLGSVGRVMFYAGLEYTSAAFASALINLIPSMSLILSILCRMERLDITKRSGHAKIGGTVVAFVGATLMTLYKGSTVLSLRTRHNHQNAASKVSSDKSFIKGSLMLAFQCLSAAAFVILQAITIRKYPAPLTLTTLTCLAGTLLATIIAAILDHRSSSWRLLWDITLVAPLYSGIMIYGITSYVQIVVIKSKGPVFVTAFKPLVTVLATVMGLLILGNALHLGEVMGATMVILGLYAILWGKEDEKKKRLLATTISDQDNEIKVEK